MHPGPRSPKDRAKDPYAGFVTSSERPLLLSAPEATDEDIEAVVAAMRSGWLAPAGPDLLAFEQEVAQFCGVPYAAGLSSGTAAIHLALKYLGVAAGDCVLVPTMTFGATAFAVTYLGAEPVFLDVDESWNLDPGLIERAVANLRKQGRRLTAAVPVDLYGTMANYEALVPQFDAFGIPMLEDAAEALGARSPRGAAGSMGDAAVLSFNGNKLITTSGGGMLLTQDEEMARLVRFWSTQSREDQPWYEHREIGYNYRLSNLLAALGRSQLRRADQEVQSRRTIREWYRSRLDDLKGVAVQTDHKHSTSNAWLTVVRIAQDRHRNGPTRVRECLARHNIEARPVWKPLHQQPVFKDSTTFLTGAADNLFKEGLCLPSSTRMTEADVDRVCGHIEMALAN